MTIREIRQASGLSQAKFAAKYEIPLRTIENWEAGVRKPPEYVVKMIARLEEMEQKRPSE